LLVSARCAIDPWCGHLEIKTILVVILVVKVAVAVAAEDVVMVVVEVVRWW
jgi:hypothetical protein